MKWILIYWVSAGHSVHFPLMQQFDTAEQCKYVMSHIEDHKVSGFLNASGVESAECIQLNR